MEDTPLPEAAPPSEIARRELLSFRIGAQDYALDITCVREIRGWSEATPLPHAPPFVLGVINLRGTVLPIIDLARRLGLAEGPPAGRHVIIVVQSGPGTVGLKVDAVSDIVAIPPDEFQPPPSISGTDSLGCVQALTIHDDNMLRVLDLAAVLPDAPKEAA